MEKKRIEYLDMAKGIGIILVVMGHSTFLQEDVLTWISSFHMPLFFVLSGMLIRIKGEERKKTSVIVKNKLKSIMIQVSENCVLLADNNKLDQYAFSQVCTLNDINVLITNKLNDKNFKRRFQRWLNRLWEEKDRQLTEIMQQAEK